MAKTPKLKNDEIELQPDAWNRFERAVDAAIKSGPKHRVAKKKKTAGRQIAKKAIPSGKKSSQGPR
jgi:hypothetical protein